MVKIFTEFCSMIHRRRFAQCVVASAIPATPLLASSATPRVLRVGPRRAVKSLAQAAREVRPGMRVDVDTGDYLADVSVWQVDDVTVRAVGGRVRLLAQGASAEGKAIWVVRARRMRVQGLDFEGCRVEHRNGAGIRFERGSLHLLDCGFALNEMGLLTSADPAATLAVENCEFAYNMRPDGHNHNLYVGPIARVTVTGSYFHHARIGHLIKSRAARSHISYNRITDENGGMASYELEFPNGGIATVVGNLIEQRPETDNPIMVSFGAEGYTWPRNSIYLAHNTFVNRLPQDGICLRVAASSGNGRSVEAVRAVNNLLVGNGILTPHDVRPDAAPLGDFTNNLKAGYSDFVDPEKYDFRLQAESRLVGRAVDAGTVTSGSEPINLTPRREYFHPRTSRSVNASLHNPGAFQSMA